MLKDKLRFLAYAINREKFFALISTFLPTLDPRYTLIEEAYKDAKEAFRQKVRDEGIRYFEHLRAVALILIIYLRVTDYRIIIAGLLHDIVEDCPSWSIERVRKKYGEEIALLVEYMTKPKGYKNDIERDEVYHRRFRFASRDFFLIKLSDRLHNLITLDYCRLEKRIRKIEETKRYYLPYAEQHFILFHEIEEALGNIDTKSNKIKKHYRK